METGTIQNKFLQKAEIEKFIHNILDSNEWDVLILITRKGYWVYKTLVKSLLQEEALRGDRRKILTDRYLTKCLDYSEFENKNVWILDDTMTNGTTLFFYFSHFRKKGIMVTPMVYALSTQYSIKSSREILLKEYERVVRNENLSQQEMIQKADREMCDFDKDLQYRIKMSPEDIARLCILETRMFQDNLCPMVIDLPILSITESDGEKTFAAYMNQGTEEGIVMSREQFEKLKNAGSRWEYVENPFVFESIDINCNYFRLTDDVVSPEKLPFLHDLIVKCKYREANNKVRLVFVPFAIFKSMTLKDMANAFGVLFAGTKYEKYISDCIEKKVSERFIEDNEDDCGLIALLKMDHDLCRNMYRSVIFYVSDFVGLLFKKYVKQVADIEIGYDFKFMRDSFTQEFITDFEMNDFNEDEYRRRLAKLQKTETVQAIDVRAAVVTQKKAAGKDEIENYVTGRMIMNKNAVHDSLRARTFTIEAMDEELSQNYTFKDTAEKRNYMTNVINGMLETSRFGNEIFIDNEEQILYRGFRYGENSELLFVRGMEYFYTFVLAYYSNLYGGENEKRCHLYKKYYWYFVHSLEQYFRKEKYYGNLISDSNFEFLAKYFGEIRDEKLEEQILNKMFVLDEYWDESRNQGLKPFVDNAFTTVKQWIA